MNAWGQFYKVVLQDVLSQLCFKDLDCRIESISNSMVERRKAKNVSFPILITLGADFFIGQLIICPLVTICWISAWLAFNWLMNDFLLPNDSRLATFVCILVGVAGTNGLGLLSDVFHQISGSNGERIGNSTPSHIRFLFASRCYTLIEFLTSMILWKGWWELCAQMGTGVTASLFLLSSGCLCLVCLRKLHQTIGFPFHVCVDSMENYCSVGRRMKSDVEVTWMNEWILTLINCTVTTLVDILTISSWFGIWTLEDYLANLISDDKTSSSIFSMVIGISTGVIVFLVQFVALYLYSKMAENARPLFRVFVGDCMAVIALVSTVSNLRGIWMMLISLIPVEHHPLYLSGLFISAFLILSAMGCVSSLHGGKIPDTSQGILMPGFYVTYFVLKRNYNKSFFNATDEERDNLNLQSRA